MQCGVWEGRVCVGNCEMGMSKSGGPRKGVCEVRVGVGYVYGAAGCLCVWWCGVGWEGFVPGEGSGKGWEGQGADVGVGNRRGVCSVGVGSWEAGSWAAVQRHGPSRVGSALFGTGEL